MGSSAGNRVAVIMAGGAGERFWPYSRRLRPKQLLQLAGCYPMLVEAIDRVACLIPRERVLIVAGEHLRQPILDTLGAEFPPDNVVVEPCARNTAACLALAAVFAEKRFGNPTLVVLTADHVIEPEETFLDQLALACQVAETSRSLVTFGVPPTRPDTGFGYIEAGALRSDLGEGVREVRQFREKPDAATARCFLQAENFLWNSGMFCWTRETLAEAFARHRPAFAEGMAKLANACDTDRYPEVLQTVFDAWESLPIDVAILEKASNRLVIEAKFRWDDIGSWTSLARLREADPEGNVVLADAVAVDSSDNIVFHVPESATRPLVATLGVRNLIIVVADDVVMVCDRNRPQDVKKLLQQVRDRGRQDLT